MSAPTHTPGFEPCPAYGTLCQYVGSHADLLEALEQIAGLTMSMFATTGDMAAAAKRIAAEAITKARLPSQGERG